MRRQLSAESHNNRFKMAFPLQEPSFARQRAFSSRNSSGCCRCVWRERHDMSGSQLLVPWVRKGSHECHRSTEIGESSNIKYGDGTHSVLMLLFVLINGWNHENCPQSSESHVNIDIVHDALQDWCWHANVSSWSVAVLSEFRITSHREFPALSFI